MIGYRDFIVLGVILAGLTSSWAGDPALVRVVLLDTSGSMEGERLNAAKSELLELGRTLPPSTDHPLIVVPFTDRVGKVAVCTDMKSLEACLNDAKASGGTKIASGLARALQEIQNYPTCRHASVFLYTDGEDRDGEGIRQQEELLDGLFADREKRGLHQSVIFCKRWQKANSSLLKQIIDRGHARVLDAGESRLRPVSVRPQVACLRSRWLNDSSLLLDVDFTAKLVVTGLPKGVALPGLKLSCGYSCASGDLATELVVGKDTPFRVRIPVPLDAGKSVPVKFNIGDAREVLADKELVLPQLTCDQLVVEVPIPPRGGRYSFQASAAPSGVPEWLDPLGRRARVPLELTVTIQPPQGQTWLGPVRFQVSSSKHWGLASPSFLTIEEGKPLRTKIVLEGLFMDRARTSIPLELKVAGVPPGVNVSPELVAMSADVPLPPPTVVHIEHQLRSVGPAHWTHPAQSIASFVAEVELRVSGPLPPESEVLVHTPGRVRSVRFQPNVIRSGTQSIRLSIDAELVPKQLNSFVFDLIPPKTGDAIQIASPAPIRLDVHGPTPLQVALSQDGIVHPLFQRRTRDAQQPVRLRVTPVLLDVDDARMGIPVAIIGGEGFIWSGTEKAVELNDVRDLYVTLPSDVETSFFRDTVWDADVRVQPSVASAALVGSTQTVRLRVEAPFKRYLFYGAGFICASLALWFLTRTVYRILSPGEHRKNKAFRMRST